MVSREGLADLLLRGIDGGLGSALGEIVTKVLYHHFEERTGLKVEDALKNPNGLKTSCTSSRTSSTTATMYWRGQL